jgi:hypothetical protein
MSPRELREEIEKHREQNDELYHQVYHKVFKDKELVSLADCLHENCKYLGRKIIRGFAPEYLDDFRP